MIEIVKLDPSEWKGYKNLRLEALKNEPLEYGNTYEEAMKDTDEYWESRLVDANNEKNCIYFFAKDGEKLIGMMGAYWDNSTRTKHIANLIAVYVSSAYRGQGIASKILEAVLERIKSMKRFRKIKLAVTASNEPAKKLYEKFGFVQVGYQKDELYLDGKYYDDILMELYL